jgi:5-methylcytosine-specific restriction protein A
VARICSTPGCPHPVERGRCDGCRRSAEQHRGSAAERGYGSVRHARFRAAVLDRDPLCVVCDLAVATVADHYPRSRRELLDLGLDADDPRYGRGLCHPCHGQETARLQPGGWAAENAG